MRPATRVVPKAMLTVVDRPAIQYAVEEAARAGAKEAIVVVDADAGHMISQHFTQEGSLPGLEGIQVRTVVQTEPLGLGHAVNEAALLVGERAFFCLLFDNIVRPGNDVLAGLAGGSRNGTSSVVCLRELSDEFLSRYGVVVPDSEVVTGYLDLAGAVEKPGSENAPSRYGLVGRYLFTPEVFSILDETAPGLGCEIQLTDAVDELGKRGRLRGWIADHDLLDVGNPEGLLHASYVLGSDQFGSQVFEDQ